MTYAYGLEYEERPNYERMKFLCKKVIMDKGYVVDQMFDWSLRHG